MRASMELGLECGYVTVLKESKAAFYMNCFHFTRLIRSWPVRMLVPGKQDPPARRPGPALRSEVRSRKAVG